ncbi:popeye domain-containing protein 2 [Tachyglossus aculeatus]|uniref:popeye domain-containing protein 2 n=1 Tax=Tachyglossus aculeatus TaxID=9261 RepID=UPI0018F791D8|nr:popeye domain-containing protein 2 [Tachyglossus aculeatus]
MGRNASVLAQLLSPGAGPCGGWAGGPQGAPYHLGNCFFLLGYMGGSGPHGSLYVFGLLAAGFLCSALWAWLGACQPDLGAWSALLGLACLLQAAHLVYRLRQETLREEFARLYEALGLPLRVPLPTYREVVRCCEERVLPLALGQTYAVEGETPIDRLSLLLSGRVRVSQDGQFLHYVFPYQFLDSPEWESLRPAEEGKFQVTLTAETECSYVSWPRGRLNALLGRQRDVSGLFSALLGHDICEKLYALNDKLFAKFGLRFDIRLPSLYRVLGPAPAPAPDGEAAEPPAPDPARPADDDAGLLLEDFSEMPGSFMDYGSEGEYLR